MKTTRIRAALLIAAAVSLSARTPRRRAGAHLEPLTDQPTLKQPALEQPTEYPQVTPRGLVAGQLGEKATLYPGYSDGTGEPTLRFTITKAEFADTCGEAATPSTPSTGTFCGCTSRRTPAPITCTSSIRS